MHADTVNLYVTYHLLSSKSINDWWSLLSDWWQAILGFYEEFSAIYRINHSCGIEILFEMFERKYVYIEKQTFKSI